LRVVLDTNVFVSGVFFGGPPGRILEACAAGVPLIVSGDRDLLEQSGWRDIRVLEPRAFVEEYLRG
jgi:predicted nucleic acid-binding protein